MACYAMLYFNSSNSAADLHRILPGGGGECLVLIIYVQRVLLERRCASMSVLPCGSLLRVLRASEHASPDKWFFEVLVNLGCKSRISTCHN